MNAANTPNSVIDQVQIRGDDPHRRRVNQIAAAQRLFENPQDIQRLARQVLCPGKVDAALNKPKTGFQLLAAAQEADQGRLTFGVARFELCQEDAGQLTDAGGVAKIILHEMFDRAPSALVTIAHAGGDLDLKVKGQLVHRTAGDVVKVTAHIPQEILGDGEGIVFIMGQQTGLDEARCGLYLMQILTDPVQGLKVAQTALALFDVRFQHIALTALLFVARGAFGQLGLDEFRPGLAKQFRPKLGAQLAGQRLMPGEETTLEQGGANGDVFACKADAVLDGAGGVTDLQPQIPQDI